MIFLWHKSQKIILDNPSWFDIISTMKLKLNAVNHGTKATDKNRYCGPSVISAVTGLTTGEAARLIRAVTGKASVKGTYASELIGAFAKCNIEVYSASCVSGEKTLGQWLKESSQLRGDDVYLVSAGHHWQLVQGRKFVCGITREVVSQQDGRVKRKAKVKSVYRLTASGKIEKPAVAKKPKPKRMSPTWNSENTATKEWHTRSLAMDTSSLAMGFSSLTTDAGTRLWSVTRTNRNGLLKTTNTQAPKLSGLIIKL